MKNNYAKWRGYNKRHLCNNTMGVWMGMWLMRLRAFGKDSTTEEYKENIRNYPYPTYGCRCRDCRYHRLANKYLHLAEK